MTAAVHFKRLLLLTALGAAGVFLATRGLEYYRIHRFDRLIRSAAARNGIDPGLVSAVIWRESNYAPARRGKAGEFGLMQIREAAGREWAKACSLPDFQPEHLYNPCTNIEAGTWYLARAIRRWEARDFPEAYALAEYNAGLTHARRWAAMPGGETAKGFQEAVTYPTTRAYIREVLNRSRSTN